MGIWSLFRKGTDTKQRAENGMQNLSSKAGKIDDPIAVDGDDIPTLEGRLKRAFPSNNGLYPHEILMLDYAKTYKIKGSSFQNFWKWKYSVLNPQEILDSLFARGFIRQEDTSDSLRRLTVSALKCMLTEAGEKSTGKKDELIQRLLNSYSEDELQATLPEKHYTLTELGALELKQNAYVPYLHRHQYMSAWDMNIKLHTENPSHLKYRDILWREFNTQSGELFQSLNFGLYRNTRLSMHDFLIEENKYKTALHLLLEASVFDLSGLGNGCKPISGNDNILVRQAAYESRMTNLFTTEDKKEVTLPPGIIQKFEKLYGYLGMASDEFIHYIYQQLGEIHIHERVFNENECANIVLSTLGLEERKLKDSYLVAQQRLKEAFGLSEL